MTAGKSLEIIIPTYNHGSYIQYILDCYTPLFSNYNFIVSIHDSSTDNVTENIVRNCSMFNQKVFYYRYDSEMDVDEKTIRAIKKGSKDFVILCGDGWVIDVKSVFNASYINMNYDMILVYDKKVKVFADYFNKNIKSEEIYPEINSEYLRKHFWHSTLYGASVLSSKLYKNIDEEGIIGRFNHTNFIYPSAITETLCEIKGSIFVLSDNFLIRNKVKNARKEAERVDIIKIWCRNFTVALEKLSKTIGASDAEYIISTTGARTGLLTGNSLAGRKVLKKFNWKIYKEYKPYVLRTMACSKFTLYLILFTPRILLSMVKWIRRATKKMFGVGLDYKR